MKDQDINTPSKILDSAERLFAEHGIGSTSLRKIIAHAKVNIAAVHYHFGNKDGLIKAVFQRRLQAVNEKRLENLKKLKAKYTNQPIPVRELLEAFLTPAVSLGQDEQSGGKTFFRLAARAHSETNPVVRKLLLEELHDVIIIFVDQIKKTLPDLSLNEIKLRLVFSAGAMVQAVLIPREASMFSDLSDSTENSSKILTILIDFVSAGFLATSAKSGETL